MILSTIYYKVGVNTMSLDRKEFAEEILLREYIRKAIKVVKKRKIQSNLDRFQEEQKLRKIINKLIIQEAKKVPKWDSYGKNNLDVMFMKTNFLDALETGYKALTTTEQQRESFKTHIIENVKDLLNQERAKAAEGEKSTDLMEQDEELNITVADDEEMMGLSPDVEKKNEEDKDMEEFKVEGEDYSGLREAYDAFNLIKDTLLKFWGKMGLEEDKDIFYDNLAQQLGLYFDSWEGQLTPTPAEDTLSPEAAIPEPEGGEEETLELEL